MALDERLKSASIDDGEVTPTDGVEVTLTDPEEGTEKYCRGFHVNLDGDLYVVFAQSSTPVKLVVKAGLYYPYSIKEFRATGTTANMRVVPIR